MAGYTKSIKGVAERVLADRIHSRVRIDGSGRVGCTDGGAFQVDSATVHRGQPVEPWLSRVGTESERLFELGS